MVNVVTTLVDKETSESLLDAQSIIATGRFYTERVKQSPDSSVEAEARLLNDIRLLT